MRHIYKTLFFSGILSLLMIGSAHAYSGEVHTVCRASPDNLPAVALRACAAGDCGIIMDLPPGQFLWTWEPIDENGWRQVSVMQDIEDEFAENGKVGFVRTGAICLVDFRS